MADPANLIDRQTQLANFLVAGWPALEIPGLPPVSAAAAVGNGTQENNCRSVTVGTKDHGSDGIFQWRLDRLTNMQAFGVKNFGTWESIEAQAAYFSFECKGYYKPLWLDLAAGTKSLTTLTANICDQYERPAAESAALDARIKYATDFMAVWKPEPPVVVPPTPAPATGGVLLTPDQSIVVDALASAILATTSLPAIKALAGAILKELS